MAGHTGPAASGWLCGWFVFILLSKESVEDSPQAEESLRVVIMCLVLVWL